MLEINGQSVLGIRDTEVTKTMLILMMMIAMVLMLMSYHADAGIGDY